MDMLTQLRQDRLAFLASAEATVADLAAKAAEAAAMDCAASVDPAESNPDTFFDSPPEWDLPATHPSIGPDGIHLVAPASPPAQRPAPCRDCGSPYWWQDIGDAAGAELHCCECRRIPARSMLDELWAAVVEPVEDSATGDPPANGIAKGQHRRPAWRDWTPQRWEPFAHLDATRDAREAQEGNAANASKEGF